jgi:hypothetical protein
VHIINGTTSQQQQGLIQNINWTSINALEERMRQQRRRQYRSN